MELDDLPSSAREACELGSKKYYTGVPCKAGHLATRFTSDKRCEQCRKANGKKAYKRHADKKKAYRRPQYQTNKEREYAYMKSWRENNRDKCRGYGRKFVANNPGYSTPYMANYRYKCRNATPAWVDKEELRSIYRACPPGYHVDHIVPVNGEYVCGLHVPWNLQYLTAFENISKGNKVDHIGT